MHKRSLWLLVISACLMVSAVISLDAETVGMLTKCLLINGGILSLMVAAVVYRRSLRRWARKSLFPSVQATSGSLWSRRWLIALILLAITVPGRVLKATLIGSSFTQPIERSLDEGLVYSRQMVGRCRVHTLTVDLDKVEPVILTAKDMAHEKQALSTMMGERPELVAAVNGDYFDEGGPSGFLVSGAGRRTAPRRDRAALCFDQDDRASVDIFRFTTETCVFAKGVPHPIRQSYNNGWTPGDVGVYTHSRGFASGAGQPNLIQARVKLTAGYDGAAWLEGIVTERVIAPPSNLRPANGEVIVVAGNEPSVPLDDGAYAWGVSQLTKGAEIKICLAVSPKPSPKVISGGPELVRMRQYYAQETGNEWLVAPTARTAVGITADRRWLIVAVAEGPAKYWDERPNIMVRQFCCFNWPGASQRFQRGMSHLARYTQSWLLVHVLGVADESRGMTLREMAKFLRQQKIGNQPIFSANNLDGGASSTMVVPSISSGPVNSLMELEEVKLATALGFRPRRR